jgi:hypothetical protein
MNLRKVKNFAFTTALATGFPGIRNLLSLSTIQARQQPIVVEARDP